MGCVVCPAYFPGGVINYRNFYRARPTVAPKLETLTWPFRVQGSKRARRSGTIKAAREVFVEMGERDGISTPVRLEKLVKRFYVT
ncbi:hypothetical protein ACNKHW_15870 [Shigella flexneri]